MPPVAILYLQFRLSVHCLCSSLFGIVPFAYFSSSRSKLLSFAPSFILQLVMAADPVKIFMECLKQHNVSDEVAKFLNVELGIESMMDFVRFVPAASAATKISPDEKWEENLKLMVDDKNMSRLGNRLGIQASRVRQAWDTAQKGVVKCDSTSGAVAESDLEAPLPEHTIKDLRDAWRARHADHQWGVRLQPADSLVARLWREYQKGQPTVLDVGKCKALLHTCMPQELEQFMLGAVMLQVGKEHALMINSIVQYYFGLRLLGHGTAYACNYEVDSKADPKVKVIMAPLDINIQYADEALRVASCWSCRPDVALEELRSRDIATRSTMVTYVRQGYSQGEALKQAIIEHRIDWKSSPSGRVVRDESEGDGHEDEPPRKQRKTKAGKGPGKRKFNQGKQGQSSGGGKSSKTSMHFQGRPICKAWNDQRGCKDKKCNRVHVCDVLDKDGKPCNSRSHNRSGHKGH